MVSLNGLQGFSAYSLSLSVFTRLSSLRFHEVGSLLSLVLRSLGCQDTATAFRVQGFRGRFERI